MRIEDASVFLALADLQNVRRAAERMGLTQSAVTKVLQRLEDEFGLKLAERGGSGVVLTDAGALLRTQAESLLASYQSLRNEMAAAHSSQKGIVRIGTVPALLDVKLLPVLSEWRRQYPSLLLQISAKVSDELIRMVSEGQLDLAICSSLMPRADLQSLNLGLQRYHVVSRAGHAFAQTPTVSMTELSKAEWLLPGPTVGMRLWVEAAFAQCGLPAPLTVVQTDTSTAQFSSLIKSSNLITALMTPMFHSPAAEGLVELPFNASTNIQPLVLLSRRAAYLSPATVVLREMIQREFI